jgi:hypothetical protein
MPASAKLDHLDTNAAAANEFEQSGGQQFNCLSPQQ